MSGKPQDPSQNSVEQEQRHAETYDGQKGYDVDYKEGRFRSPEMQEMPEGGRAGSFETTNEGGYGADGPGVGGTDAASADQQSPQLPPDPEAQQGQGGQ